MKRNPYLEALKADSETDRQPWDETEFSRALAVRERTLLQQDRISTNLTRICVLMVAFTGGAFVLGLKTLTGYLLIADVVGLGALCVCLIWSQVSALRNISNFEHALFTPSSLPKDADDE